MNKQAQYEDRKLKSRYTESRAVTEEDRQHRLTLTSSGHVRENREKNAEKRKRKEKWFR